nr:MAG TPA: hypothetical protein [Caudoviricetes sp.]
MVCFRHPARTPGKDSRKNKALEKRKPRVAKPRVLGDRLSKAQRLAQVRV